MFDVGAIVARMDLALDGWNKSVDKVKGDQKTIGGGITGVGKQFSSAGVKMAAAGSAVAGGLFAMAKATANTGDELAKLSTRTGISTETLSAYKRTLDLGDSSVEEFAKGMKTLGEVMVAAANGDETATQKLAALGTTATDADGKLRPLNDVFLDVADSVSKMEDGALKNTLAVDVLGKSALGLLPTLNMGKQALIDEGDAAARMGLIFDKDAAASSERLNDSISDLGLSFKGATTQLSIALMPAITSIAEKISGVVQKFTEWTQAHPGLAAAITKVVAGAGALLAILGTGSVIIGKIIGLFGTLSTAIHGATAAKLASVSAWGVVIGLVATYAIKLQELSDAEDYVIEADKRLRETQERSIDNLSKAAVAAGFHYGQMSKLIDAYDGNLAALTTAIRKGEEGVAIQKALAEVGRENEVVNQKLAKSHEDYSVAAGKTAEATKTWIDYLKDKGLMTVQEKSDRIKELWSLLGDLDAAYKTQKIDLETYKKGVSEVNSELGTLVSETKLTEGSSRDMWEVLQKVPPTLEDNYLSVKTLDDVLDECADKMGMSAATSRILAYELARLALAAQGIVLPDISFGEDQKAAVREDVDDFKHYWDGFFNDVSSQWGDTINDFIGGNTSIVTAWNRLWKDMGKTITDFVGKFITEKLVGALQGIVSPAKDAAGKASEALGGIGTTVSSVASSIGTAISSIAGAILEVVELVATTVIDIVAYGLTTLAEAIATAATSLAAAAPSLLIVGGVALALYAGFSAINALLASGGGGSGDGMGRVVERQDIFLAAWGWWHIDVKDILFEELAKSDHRADQLDNLANVGNNIYNLLADVGNKLTDAVYKVRDAITNVPAAAGGGVFTRPTFAMIAEKGPEAAIPLERLNEFRGQGKEATPAPVLNLSASFEISAVDGASVREIVRTKIGPELVGWLKTNFGRDELRAALGVS